MAAVTILARDLRDGMTIVGDKGGRYRVIEAVINLSAEVSEAVELLLQEIADRQMKPFERAAGLNTTVTVEC